MICSLLSRKLYQNIKPQLKQLKPVVEPVPDPGFDGAEVEAGRGDDDNLSHPRPRYTAEK